MQVAVADCKFQSPQKDIKMYKNNNWVNWYHWYSTELKTSNVVFADSFISSSGKLKMVMEEGMPRYRSPFEKGNLYINFNIEFPDNNFASEDQLKVGIHQLKKSFFGR